VPNGHGGAPFLGAPVILLLMFAVVAFVPAFEPLGWGRLAFPALAGWRLAYHLHMRSADEYDGAYTDPEAYRRARRRYWLFTPLYAVAATAIGIGVLLALER
jgi:hypothetical protein